MNPFTRKNGTLHAENISLTEIASTYSTPCYVYSREALESAFRRFDAGFSGVDHLVCFAVKANPSLG
ncbi:MAG: diaminopimelate decarboxylase, partial [Nitrosomonadales bacterium]|nr:diaminopimelate decarboxylase [Nitrosomonadales bacterium]